MNIDPVSITIGWREVVVGLIAIVALYMIVVVVRMRRLRGKSETTVPLPAAEAPRAEPKVPAADAASQEDGNIGWQAAQSHLAQEAFMRGVEDELAQLREEVDALRGELAALREDMRQEVGHMRATQTVSPLYTDAMQMAQLGHDAATIAERCGIARAEAELVVALVKSQNN